jgi:hypothetical protein
MARWFGAAASMLVLVLALEPLAADDKGAKKKDDAAPKIKDAGKDKAPADKDKQEKFTWGMELVGKLAIDGNSQGDFTLHVTQKIVEPNYQAQEQYAVQQLQLAQHQAQMLRARTVQERLQAQQQYLQIAAQLAQTQRSLYQSKDLNADVQLRFADKVKVRLANLPVDYDDKGNLKRYTAKELQELRGKEVLPGFAGEVESLRSGQTVKVYLAKNATVARQPGAAKAGAKAGAAKDGKKKKADGDEDDLSPARPEAVMVLVLHDPAPGQ